MHGRGGEESKRSWHMWSIPTRGTTIIEADGSSSLSFPNSFCKDGRKITVGDCALFKPPHDAPPFIGIIRWLTADKENKLKLGVNWLYRPSEVKLGKGIFLEAAPNEIFYSFHKDEIPAASLLHPCKVAFLPKDVGLPSGISSFVCRRVYDVTNKCLWWLTDQDYINKRQEEVDRLLFKTQIEMHSTVHPGGRSPKRTPQLKGSSDSAQNNISTSPAQVKGKKRERGDQSSEPVKRERTIKVDEGDSTHYRLESALKSEIAKITDKGGLVDSEGVEKLVKLMLPDGSEKKIDIAGRSMLAGVIAATEKLECLGQFVHLKGLPVFNEWLQEVHKGKFGDGTHKDTDKSVEEFLLILLRALDKLPVNLPVLQTCNIGKSVNLLRTHKNLEIQKKVRSLVDTWKKRVEAEMNSNGSKSGSNQTVPWPAKPRLPEVSHGGRNQGISSEVAMKSSVTQLSTSKPASVKLVHDEGTTTRSASASPGSVRSVPSPPSASISLKDGLPRSPAINSGTEHPQSVARDDKSSSSSQSYNNSQSCSSEHGKTGGIAKEDARSSTAGSMGVIKTSGSSSRQRKTANGFPGSGFSGVQREVGSGRISLHKNTASERLSQSGISCEKTPDVPAGEGNGHKFIVKITNRGRTSQSVTGGSFEDPSVVNERASSSLGLSEKHDQYDCSSKEKTDAHQTNIADVKTESWQSNDSKDVAFRSDDGHGSPATLNGEECCKISDDTKVSKATSSSPGNEHRNGNSQGASFSSINALIESCVKYSEANITASVADDVGMNLLASVAAVEMSKSDAVSPTGSPQRNGASVGCPCTSNDSRVKASPKDKISRGILLSNDGSDGTKQGSRGGNNKSVSHFEEKSSGELNRHISSSCTNLEVMALSLPESSIKNETAVAASPVSTLEKTTDSDGMKPPPERKIPSGVNGDGILDSKPESSSLQVESKVDVCVPSLETKVEAIDGSLLSFPLLEVDGKISRFPNERLNGGEPTEEKVSAMELSQSAEGTNDEVLHISASVKDFISVCASEMKTEKADETGAATKVGQRLKQKIEFDACVAPETQVLGSAATYHDAEHAEEKLKSKEVNVQIGGQDDNKVSHVFPVQEIEQSLRSRDLKLSGDETAEADESTSTTADASVSTAGLSDTRVEFDLNEGFNVDDGKCGESNDLTTSGYSSAIRLISPVPFPMSAVSSGLPASITVAAAAKGPFVPPEDLLRSKGELGWKGSAATSAFRPAEPRKVLEMPLGASGIQLPGTAASRNNRPLLDFDLNVADERIFDDMIHRNSGQDLTCDRRKNDDLVHEASKHRRTSGGLDLDLNQVDEAPDVNNHSTNSSYRTDISLAIKSSAVPPTSERNVCRDFDLNGPIVDESGVDSVPYSQHSKSSAPSQPSVSGLWMNNAELGMGNFSSWFPAGNTYPAVAIPSIIPDRAEQPFPIVSTSGPPRMLGPTTSGNAFSSDVYRGTVLSSSPAVSFPTTPFQYPVLSFGNSFPLPSAAYGGGSTTFVDSPGGRFCFPAVHSQLLGPAGPVSNHYPRPYVVSLQDSSNNSSTESGKKWGRHGLDLNTGPGGLDIEGKDESVPLASRQLSVASSQAIAEEQMRMYQLGGGMLKRKEPEGGWDGYKQSSWQ